MPPWICTTPAKGLNKILISVVEKLHKGLIMMRLTSLFNLQLTVGVLRGFRQVSIIITNKDASCLKDPFILKVFGTAENTLPATLKAGKSEFCKCRGSLV